MSSARALRCFAPIVALFLAGSAATAAPPPLAAVTVVGLPEIVFTPDRDRCDAVDMPDAPVRAFRDGEGALALFGMHHRNRALRGPDFGHLSLDCRVVLESHGNPDPAAYDDRNWIAATWTDDGRRVAALLHHEYQAHTHPGRCPAGRYLACWYNTVVAASSRDGGLTFTTGRLPVAVAAAPFRQDVGQGRHRGFFNPSNIVADGRHRYVMAATTGWSGEEARRPGRRKERVHESVQESGACLLRTEDPHDPTRWRAWNGKDFTVSFTDPYRGSPAALVCRTVGPFPAPVGSLARHRGSGAWIAVFQASKGGDFPEAGFYATSSRDLLSWDTPRLVLAGRTLYDDPCASGGRLIAYPSLVDHDARGRNFDDVGDAAFLYFTSLRVDGCTITGQRDLVRRGVSLKVWP